MMAKAKAGNAGKKWKDLTREEIDRNYHAQCSKCRYRGMMGSTPCCDYITITGRSRGCSALGCKRFERGGRTRLVVGCTVNSVHPVKRREVTRMGRHMRPPKTYLGKALDGYMQAHDLNQRTLADRIGVTKTAVGEWRSKKVRITDGSIEKIADVLGIGTDAVRELIGKGMIAQTDAGGDP